MMSYTQPPHSVGGRLQARAEQFLAALFVLGITLQPIYVLPSGLPQVGDWVLAIWACLTLGLWFPVASRSLRYAPLLYGALLVAYISMVSVVWAGYLGELRVAFNVLYYIYNFLVMWALMTSISYSPGRWNGILWIAVVLSVFVILVTLAIEFQPGRVRQTAGFNNPNQLGYYSLLALCSAVALFRRRTQNMGFFLLVLSITTLMVLLSSSLAAGAGLLVALLGALATLGSRSVIRLIPYALVVGFAVGAVLVTSGLYDQMVTQVQGRLAVAGSKVETAVDVRGYSRIIDYPQYVLLGAGEGALYRFSEGHRLELHSSLGTLLFSYGIPGLTLFLIMFWYIVRRKTHGVILLAIAPLVYSLAHQGLRTTMFWLFLVIVWVYGGERGTLPDKARNPRRRRVQRSTFQPLLLVGLNDMHGGSRVR